MKYQFALDHYCIVEFLSTVIVFMRNWRIEKILVVLLSLLSSRIKSKKYNQTSGNTLVSVLTMPANFRSDPAIFIVRGFDFRT